MNNPSQNRFIKFSKNEGQMNKANKKKIKHNKKEVLLKINIEKKFLHNYPKKR